MLMTVANKYEAFFSNPEFEKAADAVVIVEMQYEEPPPKQFMASAVWKVRLLSVLRNTSSPVPDEFKVIAHYYIDPAANEGSTEGYVTIGRGVPTLMLLNKRSGYTPDTDGIEYEIKTSLSCD